MHLVSQPKPFAKEAGEHFDGQQEVVATLDPMPTIKREAATWTHAMQVRMMMQVLAPVWCTARLRI